VYNVLHIRSPLTHFRKFPEPEVLTVVQRKKGPLKGHFRAKVPVRKRKTVISTSRQQPTGLHHIFPSVGPVSSAKNCRVCFSSIDSRDHPVWRDHREEAKSGPPWEHRLTRNAGAMVPLLLPWAPTGLASSAAWCGRGTTPRGPPWSPACTLPHVRDGLRVRYRARLCPCGRPSRGRPAHRA